MTGRGGRSGPDQQHEARLRALGYLLAQKGYLEDGLAIVAIGDDFAVTGLRQPPAPQSNPLRFSLRREAPPAPPAPTIHAETITADDLDAAHAELRRRDA
jgi:hypothetical protein